ncbi:Uncharacterised protein [uncultured archaeon]|nr:Uncharacterised protein [uncultured archaeon]
MKMPIEDGVSLTNLHDFSKGLFKAQKRQTTWDQAAGKSRFLSWRWPSRSSMRSSLQASDVEVIIQMRLERCAGKRELARR